MHRKRTLYWSNSHMTCLLARADAPHRVRVPFRARCVGIRVPGRASWADVRVPCRASWVDVRVPFRELSIGAGLQAVPALLRFDWPREASDVHRQFLP